MVLWLRKVELPLIVSRFVELSKSFFLLIGKWADVIAQCNLIRGS